MAKPVNQFDPSSVRLGLSRSPHDHRTLLLESYVDAAELPVAPDEVKWSEGVAKWGMLLNDKIGCCAIAAPAHQELAWTENDKDSGGPYCPSDADVLRSYSDVSGYRPGRPETDVGCNMLDVMKYWRKRGIGKSKIAAFARLNHRSKSGQQLFRTALWRFGGLQLGIDMPAKWQEKRYSDFWRAPGDDRNIRGDWKPGTWGGHAVHAVDYDDLGVTVTTWGKLQRISYRALQVYCFEVWVPLGPSWFGPDKQSPSGFDSAKLANDLGSIR